VLPPTLAVHLAEEAPCPVVLVPRGWTPGTGPVVAGATDDGTDAAALAFAADEAETLGRPLRLVHVWRISQVVTPMFTWALDSSPLRAEHAARLARCEAGVKDRRPGLEVSTELVHGEASVEVVSAGAGAELVVVGSHGWSRVDRVLLRSVGRALAERPPCPVAVVRPAA
jgi:nucleotide-binding universal stress UspA family protein